MKTYHWNGEYWYERNWSILHHIRHWFIWIGGWEKANGEGWQLRNTYNGKLVSPAPVSLFGKRFTWFGWGWQLRLKREYLTYSRQHGRRLYISPNGTPSHATTWIHGTPLDIVTDANEGKQERAAYMKRNGVSER